MLSKAIVQCPHCKLFINESNKVMACRSCFAAQQIKISQNEKKQGLLDIKAKLEREISDIIENNRDMISSHLNINNPSVQSVILQEKKAQLEKAIQWSGVQIQKYKSAIRNEEPLFQGLQQGIMMIRARCKTLEQEVKEKQESIQVKRNKLQRLQYSIFCQIPLLLDDSTVYQGFRICDEIIQVENSTSSSDYSSAFEILDKSQAHKQYYVEVVLKLRKSIYDWEIYFNENHVYYECLISTIKNTYLVIYYISKLFDICLPYMIYVDDIGFPQLYIYNIFQMDQKSIKFIEFQQQTLEVYNAKQFIKFQESSITQMQVNLLYLVYQLNGHLDSHIQNYFNIMELFELVNQRLSVKDHPLAHLLVRYCKTQKPIPTRPRVMQIPIRLVSIEVIKFQHQDLEENDYEILE